MKNDKETDAPHALDPAIEARFTDIEAKILALSATPSNHLSVGGELALSGFVRSNDRERFLGHANAGLADIGAFVSALNAGVHPRTGDSLRDTEDAKAKVWEVIAKIKENDPAVVARFALLWPDTAIVQLLINRYTPEPSVFPDINEPGKLRQDWGKTPYDVFNEQRKQAAMDPAKKPSGD